MVDGIPRTQTRKQTRNDSKTNQIKGEQKMMMWKIRSKMMTAGKLNQLCKEGRIEESIKYIEKKEKQ